MNAEPGRLAAAHYNDLRRSCGALLGIAQGMLADGIVTDGEISFLRDWLSQNEALTRAWPGNVIASRVCDVLADGQITADERAYLQTTLQQLVGGDFADLAEKTHVSGLALDRNIPIAFTQQAFCLTGDFVFGPRSTCSAAIVRRGGSVASSPSRKVAYVVVGGMGSAEWKHGSFGTKIERAMELKASGVPIAIVHEDEWAECLRGVPLTA